MSTIQSSSTQALPSAATAQTSTPQSSSTQALDSAATAQTSTPQSDSNLVLPSTATAQTIEIQYPEKSPFTPRIFTPKNQDQRHFFPSGSLNIEHLNKEEFQRKINAETEAFSNLLRAKGGEIIKKTESNSSFWNTYLNVLPNLKNLAIILLGIPSSSAGIERFFSMCGFMSKKNGCSINTDLFIDKCILRANLDLIEDLQDIEY